MRILHLSDTTLSGSPIRIVNLLNKHTPHEARHITYEPVQGFRRFDVDMVGGTMPDEELRHWLDWADIVHYHNRWKRQEIFKQLGIDPPKKPGLIQIHSPRESEGFEEEVASGLPIAIVAQYHVRQWPEARHVVPNVVDITEEDYARVSPPQRNVPVVSYAPSSYNGKGWSSKGYEVIAPVLKRLKTERKIYLQLITEQPHSVTMNLKAGADLGVDEIVTGSYHMSSLEYLGLGIACFANLDDLTEKVVKDLTGAHELPWLKANKDNFKNVLEDILREKNWAELGMRSRGWMELYWSPSTLARHYVEMYSEL